MAKGRPHGFHELARLIHDELYRLAVSHLRDEYRDHGLRPTELVSEAYLRLASNEPLKLTDRDHFFATVSRCMRRILVDHARKREVLARSCKLDPDDKIASLLASRIAGYRSGQPVPLTIRELERRP